MRKLLYLPPLATLFCLSTVSAESATNTEEKLAIRRIAHMWEERHDPLLLQTIEKEIQSFLQRYPKSSFREQVSLMEGDLLLLQENYTAALEIYTKLGSEKNTLGSRRLHCYAKLERWKEAAEEIVALEQSNPQLVEGLRKGENSPLGLLIAETLYARAEQTHTKARLPLLKKAQTYLLALSEHDTSSSTLQRLSSISEELDDLPTAVAAQTELAQREPEKETHHLLKAAELQSRKDLPAAKEILSRVKETNDPEAALVKATLFYRTQQDQQLLEEAPSIRALLSLSQTVELDLLCARAASRQGDERTASEIFDALIKHSDSFPIEKRIVVLLGALHCYSELNQLEKSEAAAELFLQLFPNNPKASAVRLTLAQQLTKTGKLRRAEALVDAVLSSSSSPTEAEQAHLQKAELSIASGRFEEAEKLLSHYLSTRPQATNRKHALLLTVEVARKQLESGPTPESPESMLALEEAILHACRDHNISLTSEEQVGLVYSVAYKLYEKERYRAADLLLNKPPCPLSKSCSEARWLLLQAACDANGFQDWKGFVKHANKAISLDLSRKQSAQLRAALCAAFRRLAAEESDSDNKEQLLAQAEEHFVACLEIDNKWADSENLLWHARRLAVKEGVSTDPLSTPKKKNPAVLRSLSSLFAQGLEGLEGVTPQTEEDVLYLATLSRLLKESETHRKKLDQLLAAYDQHTTGWQQQEVVSYLSGMDYHAKGNYEKALQEFEKAASSPYQNRTTYAAQLEIARLRYEALLQEERSPAHPAATAILKSVDSLAANRKAAFEPVHLEAAIEAAQMRASLEPAKKRTTALYKNLKEAKASLAGNDTIIDREYHSVRTSSSEMENLFQVHLTLIDALAASAEAQMLEEQGKYREADFSARNASALYRSLKEGGLLFTPFLQQYCAAGLKESQKLVEQYSKASRRAARR